MQLTPFQLAILAVGGFASIVLLSVLSKYQSDGEFRERLAAIGPTDLAAIRSKRQAEEQMVAVSSEDTDSEIEVSVNDEA